MAARLQSVSSDIASLIQFAEGLVSRVQLLQDAATGIINIDQNEVMKVLTIASVVGIPPVLVVGIYGMNFKNMPELDWTWGYPYALALIVITALLPLIWFKWKDWTRAVREFVLASPIDPGFSAGPPDRLCFTCCALLASSTVKRSATSGDICARISDIVPRIDLRRDLDQDRSFETVEDFGGIARLHVLVHGDETLQARVLGVVFLLRLDFDAILDLLDLGEFRVHAFFGALDQAFTDIELAGAGIELLAALLQTLEDGPLGAGRQRCAVGRDDRPGRRRRFAVLAGGNRCGLRVRGILASLPAGSGVTDR